MITFFKNYENIDENGILTYVGTILDNNTFAYSIVLEIQMSTLDGKNVNAKVTYNDGEEVNSFEDEIDYNMLMNDPNNFAKFNLLDMEEEYND